MEILITPSISIFEEQCHPQMAKAEKIRNWANRLARAKLGEAGILRRNFPNLYNLRSKWFIDNIPEI